MTPRRDFDAVLSNFIGSSSITTTRSCLDALSVALSAAGVNTNDYVICAPMTYASTCKAIDVQRARVVWADIDAITGVVTSDTIEFALVSAHRRGIFPKAVICTSSADTPPDLIGIKNICNQHDVSLIHDATNAFGARTTGRDVSHFADFTCFSFCTRQYASMCDAGGLLVCTNSDDLTRARCFVEFGIDRSSNRHLTWACDRTSSLRMGDEAVAYQASQFHDITTRLDACKRNAETYDAIFQPVGNVRVAKSVSTITSSRCAYVVHVDAYQRDYLVDALRSDDVDVNTMLTLNDRYPCYDYANSALDGVRTFLNRHVILPCGWWLTAENVEHIANRVIARA